MEKKNKWIAWVVVILIILSGTVENAVRFVTDYWWFKEVGYIQTFLVKLITSLKIGIPVFIIAFIIFYLYTLALRKRFEKITGVLNESISKKTINKGILFGSVVLGFIYSSIFTSSIWFDWLGFSNQTTFNKTDPLFGQDIAFYFFTLPLMKRLLGQGLVLLFMMVMLTVLFIAMLLNVRPSAHDHVYDLNEFRFRHSIKSVFNRNIFSSAIIKIGILGGLALVLISFNNVISVYDLVYSPRGVAYGASYSDVHIALPGFWVKAGVAFLGAVLFLAGAFRKEWRWMAVGPVALIVVSLGVGIVEGGVQRFVVEPDERAKERPYLVQNIEYTQAAYNIEKINTLEFPADDSLTGEGLAANQDIVNNIRINDHEPLKQTINQLQGIRLYYQFNDVDIDRYKIDGQYRQVYISAREMNLDNLEVKVRTWVNEHMQFTHGYGVALAPVNEVSREGQPILLIKNIPPVSSSKDLNITRPEIYFGESTNNYIVVNAKEKEFDYPKGSDNVYIQYQGSAGIPLNFMSKIIFAIREKTVKLILADGITDDSKIIINRNVLERAKKIMPWLVYKDDPYVVIGEDGKLYWMIDAYTASDRYPYSEPVMLNRQSDLLGQQVNYVRNSVKIVVDAYDGDINFYMSDPTDPVAQTYNKAFKGVLKPIEEMPKDLKVHIRYPKWMLETQAEVLRNYHVSNPDVFYNGEDVWEIAKEKYMDQAEQTVEANYLMFRLPGETNPEFVLNIPLTPRSKSNMNALLMARNDGEHYGKLFLYRFPKDRLVQGPQMLESRIDQDTEISRQLTLWNQKGSSVLRGNLMTIPINNSLLYVEPIYLKSEGDRSLPEMKRVIVAFNERVVMEENLAQALNVIFGNDGGVPTPEPTTPTTDNSEAATLLDKAKELMDNSSSTLEELKNVLNQLEEKLNQVQGQENPSDMPQ